jgi:hypothetical protein
MDCARALTPLSGGDGGLLSLGIPQEIFGTSSQSLGGVGMKFLPQPIKRDKTGDGLAGRVLGHSRVSCRDRSV